MFITAMNTAEVRNEALSKMIADGAHNSTAAPAMTGPLLVRRARG